MKITKLINSLDSKIEKLLSKIEKRIKEQADYYKEVARIKALSWYEEKFTDQERAIHWATFQVSRYIITFFVILYFILSFFMMYEFKSSPLKVGNFSIPVRVETKYLIPTTKENSEVNTLQITNNDVNIISESTLTKEQIISKANYGHIISKIWLLETTRGTAKSGYHKDCEAVGKTNEFGYGVYMGLCYDSFEESVQAVDKWLAEYIPTFGLDTALCFYNTGQVIQVCSYAEKYRQL